MKSTKNEQKSSKKENLKKRGDKKVEQWNRMLEGDKKALIDLTIERKMATKADFINYY